MLPWVASKGSSLEEQSIQAAMLQEMKWEVDGVRIIKGFVCLSEELEEM